MRTAETAARLTAFERRGAGTDAERRAAAWLCSELEGGRREAALEPFWCRPNWALAHAWHVGLGVAGSLVSVSSPTIGASLVLVAIVSVLADAVWGASPGRRLTPERASQNVVSQPLATRPEASPAARPDASTDDGPDASGAAAQRVRLIVTANYDAGRAGLVYRNRLRRATALMRRVAGDGRLSPGWLGWLVITHVWLLAVALIRDLSSGTPGAAVGVLQLIPTVVLVLYLALLLELASSDFGPAAADNAAGAAVALALVRALDAAPPRRLSVELVLQGAGDGEMTGLARHLRAERRQLSPPKAIVLGIGPFGGPRLCWWTGDGNLLPLRYHHRLRDLAAELAASDQGLTAWPHRGRGASPALPGRSAGIPAINLGCLDDQDLPARSHAPEDTADALDPQALDGLLQFALMLVEAIDSDLVARTPAPPTPAPAAAHL